MVLINSVDVLLTYTDVLLPSLHYFPLREVSSWPEDLAWEACGYGDSGLAVDYIIITPLPPNVTCKTHKPCQWKASSPPRVVYALICGMYSLMLIQKLSNLHIVMLINSVDVLLTYTGVLLTSLHLNLPNVIIKKKTYQLWQIKPPYACLSCFRRIYELHPNVSVRRLPMLRDILSVGR